MDGDKVGVLYDPSPPCMNKVAEYFGTIRVKNVNKNFTIFYMF